MNRFIKMKFNLYIIGMLALVSCTHSKHTTKAAEEETKVKELPSSERIVFVNLKIKNDSISHTNTIELVNKTVTVGHLKSNDDGAVRSGNFLTCILYEDNAAGDTVKIEHPLYRVYEYMNEKNEMSSKEVKKKEAEFFLRFQLKGKTAQVKIVETLQGNHQKEIALITL